MSLLNRGRVHVPKDDIGVITVGSQSKNLIDGEFG